MSPDSADFRLKTNPSNSNFNMKFNTLNNFFTSCSLVSVHFQKQIVFALHLVNLGPGDVAGYHGINRVLGFPPARNWH